MGGVGGYLCNTLAKCSRLASSGAKGIYTCCVLAMIGYDGIYRYECWLQTLVMLTRTFLCTTLDWMQMLPVTLVALTCIWLELICFVGLISEDPQNKVSYSYSYQSHISGNCRFTSQFSQNRIPSNPCSLHKAPFSSAISSSSVATPILHPNLSAAS